MSIDVLVTRGKHESVDCARIVGFDSYEDAQAFCDKTSSKEPVKYWTLAQIMPFDGSEVELMCPDWDIEED